MPINPGSAVPIYRQIADHVRRSVAAGVYRPGEMIPSVRSMALELTVNPNTVQRAYEELEREHLIQVRRGLGMFVTAKGIQAAQNGAESAVHRGFAETIRAAAAANIAPERIRAAFDKALNEVGVHSRSGS